jgi:hypothetical protein
LIEVYKSAPAAISAGTLTIAQYNNNIYRAEKEFSDAIDVAHCAEVLRHAKYNPFADLEIIGTALFPGSTPGFLLDNGNTDSSSGTFTPVFFGTEATYVPYVPPSAGSSAEIQKSRQGLTQCHPTPYPVTGIVPSALPLFPINESANNRGYVVASAAGFLVTGTLSRAYVGIGQTWTAGYSMMTVKATMACEYSAFANGFLTFALSFVRYYINVALSNGQVVQQFYNMAAGCAPIIGVIPAHRNTAPSHDIELKVRIPNSAGSAVILVGVECTAGAGGFGAAGANCVGRIYPICVTLD